MDSFFDTLPTYPPEDISFLWPRPEYKDCRHIVISTSGKTALEGELIFNQTYISKGYLEISRYVQGEALSHVDDEVVPTGLWPVVGLVRISVVRQFMNMQITMRQLWEQCEVIFLPIYRELRKPIVVSFDDVKDLVLSRD